MVRGLSEMRRAASESGGLTVFCKFCGAQMPEGAKFCPVCGGSSKPLRPLSTKIVMVAAGVLLVLLVVFVVLAVRSCGAGPEARSAGASSAAIVGKWTNADGLGVTFTGDGYLRFTAGSVSLGYDKFLYEITDEDTLTLTPDVPVVGRLISYEATYRLSGNTLYLSVGDYEFTLTRQ